MGVMDGEVSSGKAEVKSDAREKWRNKCRARLEPVRREAVALPVTSGCQNSSPTSMLLSVKIRSGNDVPAHLVLVCSLKC